MRSRRARERRLVRPGQLVAWDPSGAHAGTAVDAQPWSSRLMVVDAADLAALAGDQESELVADVGFPEPVLSAPKLVSDFLCMHAALDSPTTRLDRDERLAEWLRALMEHSAAVCPARSPLSPCDDRALRLAYDYLGDQPERNVGLDELALPPASASFASSASSASEQACHPMRCTWPTVSAGPGGCSKRAKQSPRPASPTRAISTATSSAAWG